MPWFPAGRCVTYAQKIKYIRGGILPTACMVINKREKGEKPFTKSIIYFLFPPSASHLKFKCAVCANVAAAQIALKWSPLVLYTNWAVFFRRVITSNLKLYTFAHFVTKTTKMLLKTN